MIAQYVWSGVVVGAVYALVAIGFTMIYNATETVNFAVGESLMVGAYLILTFYKVYELPYGVALILTLACAGWFGWIVFDRLLSAPLIEATLLTRVIALMGLAAIIKGCARLIWGADAWHLQPPLSTEPFALGPVLVTPLEVAIVGTTLAAIGLLTAFFRLTRLGMAMRATQQSRRAAALMGVNVPFVFAVAWIIGTMLSALGGALLGPLILVNPDMGDIGIKSFTAAVLGGFGSIPGAILGGMLLGVAETLVAAYWRSDFQAAATFVLLIGVLAIRPTGMLGVSLDRRV
jgi:branched-chain amino acid transport system permease protein